jgi:hypothetical protein
MKLFKRNNSASESITLIALLPLLFFAGRLLLYLALSPNDLHGAGDFPIYFDVAALPGLPYFQYWVEYPPLFAWTTELVYLASGANQFLFDFILYLLLTIAGSASIWLVSEISALLRGEEKESQIRTLIYFAFLAFTSYTWWYFDLIPATLMLAAIYAVLKRKDTSAGVWLGLGILAKWFPLLLLPAVMRFRSWKAFAKITAISLGLTVLVWGLHFALSPTMTWASLQSQPSRSSWQTIWALIDGNMTTGAFVPNEERIWPEAATFPRGSEAVIPSWLTLLVFGLIGLWLLWKAKIWNKQTFLAMIGITWALFLIWSPGWSPQWVLYLLPVIVLTLPANRAFLFSFGLFLITFVEWPFLLTHHFFAGLWIIVPIRLGLLIGMIVQWYKQTQQLISDSD